MDQDEREKHFGFFKTKDYWYVRRAKASYQNDLIRGALKLTPKQRERIVEGIAYTTAVIEAHPDHLN